MKEFSALKIPAYKVPVSLGDGSNTQADYTPFSWTGFLLRGDYLPIVGAWGVFDLAANGGGTYPRTGNRFGVPNRLVRWPKILVIRNDFGTIYTLPSPLEDDLRAAGVDIHGGTATWTSGGWLGGQYRFLGTCVPTMDGAAVNVPIGGRDILTIDSSGNLTSVSNILDPSQTTTAGVAITFADRYVGGEMLVLQSYSRSVDEFGGAYTSVQVNAQFLPPVTPPTMPPIPGTKLDYWKSNCYAQTDVITGDQTLVNAARARFEKVEWHLFVDTIASSTFHDTYEESVYGLAKYNQRIADQQNAVLANLATAGAVTGVTVHNTPLAASSPDTIIRAFFGL